MYKVQIPRDEPVDFPDECAMCGQESPGWTFKLRSGTALSDLFSNWHKRLHSASCDVPVCKECASTWAWRRRTHWMIMVGSVICLSLTVKKAWPLIPPDWLPETEDGFKFIVFLLILLLALPLSGYVRQWLPVPITLHSYPKRLDFEFRDEGLGIRFDELNNFEEVEEESEGEEDHESSALES